MDAQEKNTESVIEVVESQPVPHIVVPNNTPTPGTPSSEPYVHHSPDFFMVPPEWKQSPINGLSKALSIKNALQSLSNQTAFGSTTTDRNKDSPANNTPNKKKTNPSSSSNDNSPSPNFNEVRRRGLSEKI